MKIFYIIAGIFIGANLLVWAYKRHITKIRDNANFRTVRGKALISACNKKIDFINDYLLFKRRPNRRNT